MSLIRGVDASFDPLTLTEAKCLATTGQVQIFWQCFWTGAFAPRQRVQNLVNWGEEAEKASVENGLAYWWGAYISLNGVQDGVYHVDKGREEIPDELWEALDFVVIDVELPGIPVGHIDQAIDRLVYYGKQLGPSATYPLGQIGVYANWNAWHNYVLPSNPGGPANRGAFLINAFWDLFPDIDFPGAPFGGWKPEQVLAEQWSGSTLACNQEVDRNTFYRERLPAHIIPSAEEQMLNDIITGFDGKPLKFKVLLGGPPNYPVEERTLTYGEYLRLEAFGLLVKPLQATPTTPHFHKLSLSGNTSTN